MLSMRYFFLVGGWGARSSPCLIVIVVARAAFAFLEATISVHALRAHPLEGDGGGCCGLQIRWRPRRPRATCDAIMPERCIPEQCPQKQKVSTLHPLDNVSLGYCVPWTCCPWPMCPDRGLHRGTCQDNLLKMLKADRCGQLVGTP